MPTLAASYQSHRSEVLCREAVPAQVQHLLAEFRPNISGPEPADPALAWRQLLRSTCARQDLMSMAPPSLESSDKPCRSVAVRSALSGPARCCSASGSAETGGLRPERCHTFLRNQSTMTSLHPDAAAVSQKSRRFRKLIETSSFQHSKPEAPATARCIKRKLPNRCTETPLRSRKLSFVAPSF